MLTLNNKNKVIFISLAVLIFAIHQIMFLSYLNIGSFHFDYQSALSRLIFGKIWFLKNGLTVPWFTPHICCGAPFFSNPQSEFYSPIQFLFLFLKPLTTFKVIFFIYSFLGYLGSFLILRRIFELTSNAALIGSTIFLFNHYFAFHYLSGHIGWGLFSIIPIFFYISAISLDQTNKKYSFFLITSSALIFAVMMHSGGTRIIMEILVSVFFLTLLHLIKYKNYKIILYVSISVLIGLLISASKIYAAWSFVEGLSRDVSPIYFDSIWKFISVFFDFFFLFPRESIENDVGSMSAILSIEELSFNVTILPLLVFIIYLRNLPKFTDDKFKLTFSFILFISIFILILLNFSNTAVGSIVRKIPFITNDWISFRMLAPLIILFSMLTAMMFDKISFKKDNIFTIIFLSIIIIQNLSFDRDKLYKLFSHTNLNGLLNYEVSKSNVDEYNIEKILTILDKDSKVDGPKQHDFFLENESVQFCYFSVFGYSLEALKPVVKPLIFNHHEIWTIRDEFSNDQNLNQIMNVYKGDPFFERNGNLNFINPSCYLNPKENNCKENFLFKAVNKEDLTKFLNYKPFEFKQLKLQIFFNYLSLITFVLTSILFFYFLIIIKKTPSKKI